MATETKRSDAQTAAQAKYRDKQRGQGMEHVRVWVPTEYAEWYRLAGARLREMKKYGDERASVPPVFKA